MTKTVPKVISLSKQNTIQSAKGFSLSEVLVGMLMICAFSATALQAFVSATAFKVKAQELSEANTWMQDDLELVRYKANRLVPDATKCKPLDETGGYASQLRNQINKGDDSPSKTFPRKSSIGQRPYILNRDAEIVDEPPYNVLALTYTVARNNSVTTDGRDSLPTPFAQLYAEVVPDAFMACP